MLYLRFVFLGLPALLYLVSCGTKPAPLPPPPPGYDRKADILAYERENAAFRTTQEETPPFAEFKTSGVFMRRQELGDGFRLVFKPGHLQEFQTPGGRYFRTTSRYQLMKGSKVLCEAESTLNNDDDLEAASCCRVVWHAGSRSVLIEEEHDWSTTREIVFFPTDQEGTPGWSAKVIEMPLRNGGPGTYRGEGNLLGMANGKVFIRVDGVIYAFPIRDVPAVPSLNFLPG